MPEALRARASEAVGATEAGLRAWLTSAAQSSTGGFSAWIDATDSTRAYDYAEITGYALGWLAGLETLTDDEAAAGDRAAAWLTERVRAGRFAARDGWDGDAVYLFDLGMVSSGLISFGRRAEDDAYVEAGLTLAAMLDRELSGPSISAVMRGARASERAGWSVDGVAHLAKLVQSLLLAGTGRDSAARLIEQVSLLQDADGRFTVDADGGPVMLHPHLYAAEGLWMWGSATGDSDAIERSEAAVEWAWRHQLASGGLPRTAEAKGIEQMDVTSQAIRLALIHDLASPAVDRAVARLVEVARPSGAGLALPYQPASPELHLNTWVTLFAAQALSLAVPGASPLDWRSFV